MERKFDENKKSLFSWNWKKKWWEFRVTNWKNGRFKIVYLLLFKRSAICLHFSLHTSVDFYLLIFRSPLFQGRHFQSYTSYTPSTSLTTTSVKLTTVSLPICWASGIWILHITIWNSWDQQPLEKFQPSCKLIWATISWSRLDVEPLEAWPLCDPLT